MKRLFLLLLLSSSAHLLLAQLKVDWRQFDSIPLIDIGGDTLGDAWVGGLNNPQFSTIDLDNDGKEDLFVFERDGNFVRTFINTGSTGQVSYVHAPKYESKFPNLEYFALLRDYNGDGLKDIFTYQNPGIAVYKNVSQGSNIAWEQQCYFKDFNGVPQCYLTMYFGPAGPSRFRTQIFTIPEDIPAFDDIDDDGDLDILSFGVQGTAITYYKNISTNLDTLDFAHCTDCWGKFFESSISNDIILNFNCRDSGTCAEIPIPQGDPIPVKKRGARHSGSTILTFDRDADGDKEVLLGDISFPNMVIGQNGGTSNTAEMTSYAKDYPNNTRPVELFIFPAGFYEDVNNDGVKDLIVAPNAPLESENHRNVMFYENTRSDNRPNFIYRQREFIVGDMLDLGSGTSPLLIDINGDSLLDILVGNSGYYKRASAFPSGLAYLENTGLYTDSTTYPIYTLRDTNYLNLFDDSLGALCPSAADIDADGDLDLMIGDRAGKIHFFQNNAQNQNDSVNFTAVPSWDTLIDVGSWATPTFYDLDDDGDLDLVSGERYGTLYFYLNQGDSANPVFSNSFRMSNWGGVAHQDILGDGFTQPFIVKLDTNGKIASDTSNGDLYLFVGNVDGNVYLYSNIEGNLFGNFTLQDTFLLGTSKSSIHGADLSRDGKLDLVYGQQTGGLGLLLKGRGFELPTPPPSYTLEFTIQTDSGWIIPSAIMDLEGVQRTADSLGKVIYQGLSPGSFSWSATGTLFSTSYQGMDTIQISSDTAVTVLLSPILGVSMNDKLNQLKVFPNPTRSELNISLSEGIISSVSVIDVHGRQVLSDVGNDSEIVLNLSGYNKGVYFLKVETNFGEAYRSFILIE